MDTFKGKTVSFHYSSDMSGDVIITEKISDRYVQVDGEDILEFVAEYIRSNRIAKIEQMSMAELLEDRIR